MTHRTFDSGRDLATSPSLNGDLLEPGQEPALPATLVAAARGFQAQARAERTQRAYRRAWARFETWCRSHGRQALPAAPDTIAAWLASMAYPEHGKPSARATIDQALSAVVAAHRVAAHPFDRKHPLIAETWRGIARVLAKQRVPRKAKPLMGQDVRSILADLRAQIPADARDAALLALGWGAALRRSELVALDWQKLGSGEGFVSVAPIGISITLATSKGSQADPVEIVIPRADMAQACEALETWARVADLAPGSPLLRSITKGNKISADRLTDGSVSRIIKARVRAFAQTHGKTQAEADDLVAAVSGHSLRRGYGTTAAMHDVPGYRIKQRMRHKSMDTTAGYIEAGQAWTKSGLKGIF